MLHVLLWLFSFIGHSKDKKVCTMQKGWARLVEMNVTESDQ